ncbi:MAG TPA: 2-hydroxyacyl-CoA dehydratase family protein [Spirochaetales bacterium]|nr:2-hydroxyacyl-CoA dehydratase family protein [Spirochaetales bacterium]
MNSIVRAFGSAVGNCIETKPKVALRLLKVGFGANNLQSHLSYLDPVSRLCLSQRYASLACGQAILAPLRKPQKSVVVNLFLPCELLVATDLVPQFVEGFAGYLDGACCERGFVEYAENWGVPKTYCSYHKALLGASLSSVLPKPQCVIHTTVACDANLNTFRTLASYWQVPLFVLDVPAVSVGHEDVCVEEDLYVEMSQADPNRDEAIPDEAVIYVANQFRSMAEFLEDITHRKLNEGRLAETIRREKRSLDLYTRYQTELAHREFMNDPLTEMYRIFLIHLQAGSPNLERYMELLLRDVQDAPLVNLANHGNLKKRILWVHTLPFWQNSVARLFALDAPYQLLGSDLSFDFLNEEDDLDERAPFESMARKLLRNSAGGSAVKRTRRVLDLAKRLHADGVIWFCQWGCKQTLGAANLAKQILEQQGFPVLVLDGDACDKQNINDGQMATKLQAFFEMLGGYNAQV